MMEELYNIFKDLDKGYATYNNHIIRIIIDIDKVFWFKARDVSISLEYKDPARAIRDLVDKEDKILLKNIKTKYDIKHNAKNVQPHSIYISEAGLYELIIRSNLPSAKKFKKWITHDILPSIHKYGFYRTKMEADEEIVALKKRIAYLEKQRCKVNSDCKKQSFPKGGIVYVVDYSTKYDSIYRLGRTADMNKRKKIYDTHTLHNKKVVFIEPTDCPQILESSVRAALFSSRYNYKGKIKKDFYICSLNKIRSTIKNCHKTITIANKQTGGSKKTIGSVSVNSSTIKNNYNRYIKYLIRKNIEKVEELELISNEMNDILQID